MGETLRPDQNDAVCRWRSLYQWDDVVLQKDKMTKQKTTTSRLTAEGETSGTMSFGKREKENPKVELSGMKLKKKTGEHYEEEGGRTETASLRLGMVRNQLPWALTRAFS